MLPLKFTVAGVALLFLVLCANNPSASGSSHIWHTGPINCYICDSLEECTASSGYVRPCDAQNCVAVFDASGAVIQRGCSDNLAEICADGSCYECRSHGCNNLKSNSALIDCVHCDAQSDDNCVFDIELIKGSRQCHESCITALYPRTSGSNAPFELVRSCLDDLTLDDREACAEGSLENCVACDSAKCNTVDLGVRRSCNHCEGNCDNPLPQTCRAVAAEQEQCFIQVDETGKIAQMGCRSQYDEEDVQLLVNTTRLWLCSGDNCNTAAALPAPQTCKQCNSRTDANCAVAPELVTTEVECSHTLHTDCYARLLENGHTERGCLTLLPTEDFVGCLGGANSTKCGTCSGANCNEQLHPVDRLSCHVCSSADGDSCEGAPAASSVCLLHSSSQQCLTSIDSEGQTQRGCSGSFSCDESDKQRCQLCSGADCNTDNLKRRADGQPGQWQALPISCRVCASVEECANVELVPIGVCLRESEYCMTVFDASGAVAARGCSDEVELVHSAYCDASAGRCHNCNSNNCNIATALADYNSCVSCDSQRDPDCILAPEAVLERRLCHGDCMSALRLRSNESSVSDLLRGCLDDKDLVDRQRCSAGRDADCVACKGADCNKAPVPEDRLSCFKCVGDDCENTEPSACLNYIPTDQCYILFDKDADAVGFGCRSDLTDAFVTQNIHMLHLCDGDNCNSFDNFPKPNNCLVCDSKLGEDCAANPGSVLSYDTCSVLPNTGCMTRVHTDGTTQRGCVSSLSTTNIKACLNGEGNCVTCSGSLCNKEIYPADRRRCHRCNSRTDTNCELAPASSSVCPLYRANQGCSVKLVDGETYRGCETEFKCDDSDKQHCRFCNTTADNCNVADLINSNIGYPGKWQTPPVNCYTCEGADCQDGTLGPLRKCEGNNQQNCATVFAANGSVVLRGCSDLVYKNAEHLQYCDASPGSCKYCKSTGCNTARQLDGYVNCVLCNTEEQKDCVIDPTGVSRTVSCQGSCFTGLYARSSEPNPAFELSRGCLNDLEYDDQLAALAGELDHAVPCTGAGCNLVALPETRLSCNYCADEDCETVSSRTCTAYRAEDQCYIHVGDLRIESMGCASDLETSFLKTNRRDLQLCSGDNCNDKEALNVVGIACVVCNSTSSSNCIKGQASAIPVCHHYLNPECYTHITDDGVVVRGCLMDTSDELYDDCLSGESTTCEVCASGSCNNKLYPADWHSCVRCDSGNAADCEKSPASHGAYCPSYVAGDSCVTRVEKSRTRRGCSSELSCDASQPATCRICEANNCNQVNLLTNYVGEPGKWQPLPLSCQHCEDAASCALGTSESTVHICGGNLQQVCSTVFGADNEVLARGCSDGVDEEHLSYCEANPGKCFKCKSDECNVATSPADYVDCYFCDADEDPSCAQKTPTAANTRVRSCHGQCMVGLYPRSSAADSALLPVRGCLDDLNEPERASCAAGDHASCKICSGAFCNTESIVDEPNECYHCLDAECEDIESQLCVAYRPHDQCFLAFGETGVIAMGCASDFETTVLTELVQQQKALLCSGKNCNIPTIIPDPNSCSVCSSGSDSRCATNPNQLLETNICSDLPYTQCVTRIDDKGATQRGCLSELDSGSFYNCLTGEDKLCEICQGERCNGLSVFPAERRRCHQCDSATNPLCASSAPASSAVCAVYAEDDGCVSTIRNEITYRGCASSLSCEDPSNSRSCRRCEGNNCNTIDLERLNVDGAPGVWQEVPISCLHCSSVTECAAGGGTSQQCTGNLYQNCLTVFDATGAVSQRGCSDSVLEEPASEAYCDEDPAHCPRCNSNNCNVAVSSDDYVECLACDSSKNGVCVNNVSELSKTRRCHKECVSAYLPLFGEDNESYATLRNCADDLEAADRTACAAGIKQNCAICSTDKCNTVELAESRHSCLSCSGDEDCQTPQPALCPNYREGDQCYIEFDERRSVASLGCLSQYSHQDIYELKRAQRLLVCEAENCNTLESIPAAQSCSLCSSRTDARCAVNPSGVTSETSCQLNGLPECYSRVLADGSTERGCLSSLEGDEFLGCYNGSAASCDACRGSNCNKQVYPTGRASCHICDSQSSGSCAASPNSLSICPVYADGDACVTAYSGGVTRRGCASSLSCEENSRSCVKCVGDGCNVVDLASGADDNFGKWQDLPLRCLSCSGADCSAPTSELCADNNEQDCLTVFDAAGAVVRRGCADAVARDYGEYCAANSGSCPNCKSNECNSIAALDQLTECVYCDSNKDASCLWQPSSATHKKRLCQGECMSALYGSADNGLDLIRTCLNDKETADQTKCASEANCVPCSGASCNVANVPANRLSCYTCEEDDCEEPEAKVCAIYKPNDSCFLWVDESNSIKQLGCLSSFRNQDLESIIKTKRVAVCEGANCNLPMLPSPNRCALCDSKDDESCAINALAVVEFATCSELPHTSCVTRLESDGSTTRGCLYDLSQEDFAGCLLGSDENCAVCDTDGCNREIYPADRLQCFSCTSEHDANCESYPSTSQACAWVRDGETCQTSLANNITTRGCSSSVHCETSDYDNCRACKSTECNGIDLANREDDGPHGEWQELPLSCHVCEGEHCHSSLGPAAQCVHRADQDCKTVFEEDGETVRRRGCADIVDDYEDLYCRQHPERCFSCKSNNCNSAWRLSDYVKCAYCNSETDELCAINPQNAGFASRSCHGECLVALRGQQIIRSCLDDKEEYDRSVCANGNGGVDCARCNADECNKFVYPAQRLSCHTCTGSNCSSSIGSYCRLFNVTDYCFAKYNGNAVELMGCASSQSITDLDQWKANKQLYDCDQNDCNELNRLPTSGVCLACDSSKSLECAQDPTKITTTETCPALQSDCVTRLDEDGKTHRGCLSQLSSEESSKCVADGTCSSCAGEKCNVAIFPQNRRKCHICNSTSDPNCAKEPNHVQICPIYAAGDSCVTKRSDDNFIQRGCLSELTCEGSDEKNCQICESDGCNVADLSGAAAQLGSGGLALTLLVAFVVSKLRFSL